MGRHPQSCALSDGVVLELDESVDCSSQGVVGTGHSVTVNGD